MSSKYLFITLLSLITGCSHTAITRTGSGDAGTAGSTETVENTAGGQNLTPMGGSSNFGSTSIGGSANRVSSVGGSSTSNSSSSNVGGSANGVGGSSALTVGGATTTTVGGSSAATGGQTSNVGGSAASCVERSFRCVDASGNTPNDVTQGTNYVQICNQGSWMSYPNASGQPTLCSCNLGTTQCNASGLKYICENYMWKESGTSCILNVGGSSSVGGSSNKGGSSSVGGSSNKGGSSSVGGSSNKGGSSSVGGSSSIGGSLNVGGTTSTTCTPKTTCSNGILTTTSCSSVTTRECFSACNNAGTACDYQIDQLHKAVKPINVITNNSTHLFFTEREVLEDGTTFKSTALKSLNKTTQVVATVYESVSGIGTLKATASALYFEEGRDVKCLPVKGGAVRTIWTNPTPVITVNSIPSKFTVAGGFIYWASTQHIYKSAITDCTSFSNATLVLTEPSPRQIRPNLVVQGGHIYYLVGGLLSSSPVRLNQATLNGTSLWSITNEGSPFTDDLVSNETEIFFRENTGVWAAPLNAPLDNSSMESLPDTLNVGTLYQADANWVYAKNAKIDIATGNTAPFVPHNIQEVDQDASFVYFLSLGYNTTKPYALGRWDTGRTAIYRVAK